MSQHKKKRPLQSQIKVAVKESGLLHQPAKITAGHILNAITLGIFTLAVTLLAFPFTPRSILAESTFVVLVIWISKKCINPTRTNSFALRFWLVVTSTFIFSAACPFIVLPKPVYIAVLNSQLRSKAYTLRSGDKTIGSAMLVSDADFVRQYITPIAGKIFPKSFRIIEKREAQFGSYYTLPVFKGFIFDVDAATDIPAKKSVYFPSALVAGGLQVSLSLPQPITLSTTNQQYGDFQVMFSSFCIVPLVSFTYDKYPNTVPWDAVQVQEGQDIPILIYSALLDRSLEFFATGETEEAINGLTAATAMVPPRNLEGARLAALKFAACKFSFSGNVGDLQSLPLLHNTYDLFLQSENDPRFSEKDPLANWLRALLLDGYQNWNWSTLFFDRISTLKAIPHIANEDLMHNRYTDVLDKTFAGKTYEETLEILQSRKYSSAELHYIKYMVVGKLFNHLLAFIQNSGTNNAGLIFSFASEESRKATPLILFIDSSLAQRGGLESGPFAQKIIDFLDFLNTEVPKIPTNTSDANVLRYFAERSKAAPEFGYMTNLLTEFGGAELRPGKLDEIDVNWWSNEYEFWFYRWSLSTLKEIERHEIPWHTTNEPPEFNMKQLVSTYGCDYFTHDKKGKGRTFLPGLFVLAWYGEVFGLPEADELKQQFEHATLLPLDTYVSKLYPPQNQEFAAPIPSGQ